ncbi:MAG: WecB/TagA/CpsF family glycosyltransferase [Bacteroidota bacterium]|nr:WecB/TagA/CpsF family glycosyltransferase [Bacteroidota bacterium]
MLQKFSIHNQPLSVITAYKSLITTINAHCYNITQIDSLYNQALLNSDVLIPDGISVVWAIRFLKGEKLKKIAGADLFFYELERLQKTGGKCFFLGSTNKTLRQIKEKINREYPNIKVEVYSPPYKAEFNKEDNRLILEHINSFEPDVLMVGMTAPKQEKWAYQHYNQLQVGHICCIGAVFDFYAGTIKRAPKWIINLGMEWFYRLIKEPRRMWHRYLIGNYKFIWAVLKEKIIAKPRPYIVIASPTKEDEAIHSNHPSL